MRVGRAGWHSGPVKALRTSGRVPPRVRRAEAFWSHGGLAMRRRSAVGLRDGHLLALSLIVLAGVAVRAALLREPMGYDEAFSFLTYARHPVEAIVASYGLPNNHVLNTVLMHESWQLFGNHLWSIRLPAFVAGCSLAPAAYLAARRLYGRDAGLWAAGFAASAAPLIDYSVVGRGYTLGLMFVLLALWSAAVLVEPSQPRRSSPWWPWPVLVVSCALALWSVPTMAFGVATVALWAGGALLAARDFKRLLAVIASFAMAAFATYLLYRPTLGQHGWAAGKEVEGGWAAMVDLAAAVWQNWNRATPALLQWLIAAAFVGALVGHRRLGHTSIPPALAAIIVLATVLVTGLGAGRFVRYWLAFLPFYLITAAAGLAWMTAVAASRLPRLRPAGSIAPVALTVLLSGLLLAAGQHGSEAPPTSDNGIVNYLRDELKPGEVAMQPHTFAPAVNYYFDRYGYPPAVGHVTPAMRQTGHAIVIAPGDDPREAAETMRALGAVVGREPPRLLKRFEYISVWDVPIDG